MLQMSIGISDWFLLDGPFTCTHTSTPANTVKNATLFKTQVREDERLYEIYNINDSACGRS